MATELNHTLNFAAPVIPAPTTGIPSTYYNNLNITVNASQCSNDGLEYIITRNNGTHTLFDHYLMMDGDVYFIKQGDPFPTKFVFFNNTVATSNSILLKINIGLASTFKKYFSNGVPIPKFLLIENIDEASFRVDLKNYIQDSISGTIAASMGWNPLVSLIMQFLLNNLWDSSGNIGNIIDDKIDHYINTVVNNTSSKVGIFMPGGIKIGKVLNNANGSSKFRFKVINSNDTDQTPNYLPAVSYMRQLCHLPNGAKWLLHPLLTSISGITSPLDFYLKFEIWNPNSVLHSNQLEFVNIADGCIVKLMNYGTIDPIIQKTILDGKVDFHASEFPANYNFGAENNYYFLLENLSSIEISIYNSQNPDNQINLPEKWSTLSENETDYWLSTNGSPGYLKSFSGFRVGSINCPMIFRIGLDYHIHFTYLNEIDTKVYNFPKGITCYLVDKYADLGSIFNPKYQKQKTNEKGQIHGINFLIKPNSDLSFFIRFEIEDQSIHLNRCFIDKETNSPTNCFYWFSKDYINFPNFKKTTLGLIKVKCTGGFLNAAAYLLKIVREWAFFFFHLSQEKWYSLPDLEINIWKDVEGSMSYPKGSLYLGYHKEYTSNNTYIIVKDYWTRRIIVHELSHTVMYQLIDNIELDVAVKTGWLNIWNGFSGHYFNSVTDQKYAFVEGWAEFIEALFSKTSRNSINSNSLKSLTLYPTSNQNFLVNHLKPMPFGTGNYVEGAVCNALTSIFWKYIVGLSSTANEILESEDGDLSKKNPWILNTSISNRFCNFFYDIMKEKMYVSNSENYNFFKYLINKQPLQIANYLRCELYHWNLEFFTGSPYDGPKIEKLIPSYGNESDLDRNIEIIGNNFVDFDTSKIIDPKSLTVSIEVYFDGLAFGKLNNNLGYGYYFSNGRLFFKRPSVQISQDVQIPLKVVVYVENMPIVSNIMYFLLNNK